MRSGEPEGVGRHFRPRASCCRGNCGWFRLPVCSLAAADLFCLSQPGARTPNKTVRQTVSLPAAIATQVRSMAKSRRLSTNRMLVEIIENGIAAEKRKQQEFFDLAERFRAATDAEDVKRLGDESGRMVFGG